MISKLYIILISIVFSLVILEASSQTIVVKTFRKLETDQEARIVSPKTDQNGKKCAIIKVVTSQTGFAFDFGMIGNAVATEQKLGEIWVWVPVGARKVTINHQQLGVLRNYPFEIDIEEATVYEMVLTTGTVTTVVNEVITSQWLVIKTEPTKAMIYLDDQFVKTGEYQAKLKPGTYTYRVEASLYHTEAGKLEIKDTKKEMLVSLKPAFGYISVTTNPESSASVIIDGKEQSQVTPCKSEPLASGEHTVQVVKEMFQPSAQKVTVADDQTTPVSFTLKPNFAEVNFTSSVDATLFVNNVQKGTGKWQGRLNSGIYSLEARKDKHLPAKQDIELVAGDNRTVDLQPTPIYGSLDILTSPSGATITIEGKDYGTTPNTIDKLLIGDYKVQLNKTGYAAINVNVAISEGKNSEVNETLVNGRVVSINSEPIGANLTIDGNPVGQTPYTGNLTFGSHILQIEQGEKKAEKTITIAQTGGETTFNLNFEETVTDIDGNVYHTVTIGTQVWMVENLKTTKYNDGTSIPNITDNTVWINLKTPGYCWYDNNATTSKNIYGALYNWYTVNTGKLAPKGWHIPTNEEWIILTTYLGGDSIAGGKLKEAGTTHWYSPNTGATNASGFAALPCGYRTLDGTFVYIGIFGYWWSSTEYGKGIAFYRRLDYDSSSVFREDFKFKQYGFSVRCVRDY